MIKEHVVVEDKVLISELNDLLGLHMNDSVVITIGLRMMWKN
ncbi:MULTISPECIES: hypothetical protein [Bacillus cereus group]|nr:MULTISPECIES: hypothetical protein [Bacillus cereus group]MCU4986411.1 hypothetical protein [Bacillus cereus]